MPDDFDFDQSRPARPTSAFERLPIITYLLVAFNVIVFGCHELGASLHDGSLRAIGQFGRVAPSSVWNGNYLGLISSAFAHGSLPHILFNMLWLAQLGAMLEASLNPVVYLAFLAASAAVGASSELVVDGQTGIGFSGVVYAMFGLMWAGRHKYLDWKALANPYNFRVMVGWGVFCVFATYLHILSIANAAHGAGFLFGIAVGSLFFSPRPIWLWSIPLAILLVIDVLGATWMPWSADWNGWKGDKAFDAQQYPAAIRYYEGAIVRGASPSACTYNIGVAWGRIGDDLAAKHDTAGAKAAYDRATAAIKASGYHEEVTGDGG